jgi:hypothetical protein
MCTGKSVARHAAKVMAALVQWLECLPRGVLPCPELHAYLDAAHVY